MDDTSRFTASSPATPNRRCWPGVGTATHWSTALLDVRGAVGAVRQVRLRPDGKTTRAPRPCSRARPSQFQRKRVRPSGPPMFTQSVLTPPGPDDQAQGPGGRRLSGRRHRFSPSGGPERRDEGLEVADVVRLGDARAPAARTSSSPAWKRGGTAKRLPAGILEDVEHGQAELGRPELTRASGRGARRGSPPAPERTWAARRPRAPRPRASPPEGRSGSTGRAPVPSAPRGRRGP